jgi:DNA-binding response OmpR family regulator
VIAKPRVLVVDDDEAIRDGLSDFLEDEGFAVAAAADGEEALSFLRHDPEQAWIVLLDLMMPVMDGFEFLKAKENEASLATVPVIAMTAAGPIVEKKLRLNHRVHDCLAKPLRLERLLEMIRAYLPPAIQN